MKINPSPLPIAEEPKPQKAQLPENPQLRQVAKSFEAIFVNQMVGSMRKTVTKNTFVPESHAEKVYQGMLDSEYSQRMAESGQLGLSNLIYEHLLRIR